MSLFVCDQCGHVDNTALTHYWGDRYFRRAGVDPGYAVDKDLCSQCHPEISAWHGKFIRCRPSPGVKYANRPTPGGAA